MRVLLTGVNGYIGARLLPVLLEKGHEVICIVRNKNRFLKDINPNDHLTIVECDLLKPASLKQLPADIDAAYYLPQSIHFFDNELHQLEKLCLSNFISYLKETTCQQLIILDSLINKRSSSALINRTGITYTFLKSSIIIGEGCISTSILQKLIKNSPLLFAPKWIENSCQPIALKNVLDYLTGVLGNPEAYNQEFEIGGPNVVTYKELISTYFKLKKINRQIITMPLVAAEFSSYSLFSLTDLSLSTAKNIIQNLKNELLCSNNLIREIVPLTLLNYKESLELVIQKESV